MKDSVIISELEVFARIGTTKEERSAEQRLTVSLELWPVRGFDALGDRLENTIDYAGVRELALRASAGTPRNLIETLAEDLAAAVLATYRVQRVRVEVRKYIFSDTSFVGVRLERDRTK